MNGKDISEYDVIIIGAGAAGMMCAAKAGQRGRRVWLVDHAAKLAEKIRISGGGRCNFTNIHAGPGAYLSQNRHFCKSALKSYTARDFIELVDRHGIAWHEKKLGQLFCKDSAEQIINMLVDECRGAGVELDMGVDVGRITFEDGMYHLETSHGAATCRSLVIATGGLSIPKLGATPFGYRVAQQFDINIIPTRAGLVPLTFTGAVLDHCRGLSGISVDARVMAGKTGFDEGFLFTHRGISGPSVLQISSYWQTGTDIQVDLAPGRDVAAFLKTRKTETPKQDAANVLGDTLPGRLASAILAEMKLTGRIVELPDKALNRVGERVNRWRMRPSGHEGYRTAEVTLGGIDTNELSSKTMEAKAQPGLYFIGEVVDVTGHLGGYNFQWAWSSAVAAGKAV